MSSAVLHSFLYKPLDIYHIEAYFDVKERTARKKRTELLEYLERRSSCLFLIDLYEYDNWKDPIKFAMVMNEKLCPAQQLKIKE